MEMRQLVKFCGVGGIHVEITLEGDENERVNGYWAWSQCNTTECVTSMALRIHSD